MSIVWITWRPSTFSGILSQLRPYNGVGRLAYLCLCIHLSKIGHSKAHSRPLCGAHLYRFSPSGRSSWLSTTFTRIQSNLMSENSHKSITWQNPSKEWSSINYSYNQITISVKTNLWISIKSICEKFTTGIVSWIHFWRELMSILLTDGWGREWKHSDACLY